MPSAHHRVRSVEAEFGGLEAIEGAGVRLRRLFGHAEVPRLDPFLLLDHFRSSDPSDYVAGFPWHPHRGIETVTYMLNGQVDHGDTLGNRGTIDSGDVQWMSSGSGIMHQEMPRRMEGTLDGFQLWVNMPSRSKMSTPEYRGVRGSAFPTVNTDSGTRVKVVAGTYEGAVGPVDQLPVDPTYLDVTVRPGETFTAPTVPGHTTFAYPIEGSGKFDPTEHRAIPARTVAVYGDGESVEVRAGADGVRFLLVSGRPIGEPVAWYGPIVMNKQEELQEAIRELRSGDFIKDKHPVVDE
ncbi:MAG: pirin family protein [Candidatus Lutacidiplasmatales archaeon]